MKTYLYAVLLASFAIVACSGQSGPPNHKLTQHLNASTTPAKLAELDIREVRIDCHSDDGHAPYKVTLFVEDNYGLKTFATPDNCDQPGQQIDIAHPFSGSDKFEVRTSADYAPELLDRYLAYLPTIERERNKL